MLIGKLSDIQTSLPNEYRNDTILWNKLLNAVRDVDTCCLACDKPTDNFQGFISDIHASLATIACIPVQLARAVVGFSRNFFCARDWTVHWVARAGSPVKPCRALLRSGCCGLLALTRDVGV